ncbi:MAG TPA: marine proteobacterial sortase target protein [Thermoanaerobaculia bacterium]|nr:marine proteobacterial sortase target protein [Thermoanaerobaculia bacterium]
MRWNGRIFLWMMFIVLFAGRAFAAERGLRLQSAKSGKLLDAPVLGTTVEMRVTGIIARARVTQIYSNPTQEWMEGIYLFPLPDGAAVDTLHLRVGERVLEGVVQEKKEARQTYETAKQQGTKATLIEQRKDVFTTSVANIGPGETVEVAIELQQIVRYANGRFTLRFPMVVAPKYTPAHSQADASACAPQPPVIPAGMSPINPFALHVDLSPGFPLARVDSSSHKVAVTKGKGKDGGERWAVDLASGVEPADSDFVLGWAPVVGREPRAVFFSEEVDGEQYSLLMMMPPDDPSDPAEARLARETTFIIDTSGSMEGTSIEQARRSLRLGLDRLQPGDWFNVIQFNSTANALFPASVPADPDHLAKARQYVQGLRAQGGTEMLPALQIALGTPGQRGLVQQVIFITDGEVSNDADLLAYIAKTLGEHRLFTVAIGSSPNAAFLRKAAEIGRGTFTAINSIQNVAMGMGALIAQLDAPVLREIDVRWPDPAVEIWPPHVPDLYRGEPLVLTARQRAGGAVKISGTRSGRPWSDALPGSAVIKNAGIDKLWAQQKIDSLLDSLATDPAADRAAIQREVTELGLRHHLVTVHTSLVAVDTEVTAPAGIQRETRVLPVNAPRGSIAAGGNGDDVEDVITVLGETPLLDERRISTGATVSNAELDKIPTARDPWEILQTTPGVLSDRINEAPSAAVLAGSAADQNVFELDGVAITNLEALGTAPAYYDFDAFEEISVNTGGADVTQPTSGARVEMITKRGTNEWRGSTGATFGGATGQAGHGPADNRLDSLRSLTAEGGGPLRKDFFWLWGALQRSTTDRIAFGGQPTEAVRTNGVLKLNAQPVAANSFTLLASRGDLAGSGVGAGPERSPETTWTRGSREDVGKIEDTHIFSSNFYLTATVEGVEGRLRDDPAQTGGNAQLDTAGEAHGSWFARAGDRRSRTGLLNASYFLNTGSISHELKIGAEERRQDDGERLTAPGLIAVPGESVGGLPFDVGEIWKNGNIRTATGTTGLWAQDILSAGNLTATAGLRADEQDLGLAGGPRPRTLTPRLGLTWSVGPERQTLLRASLSQLPTRLGDRAAIAIAPGASGVLYSYLVAGAPPRAWYVDGVDPLTGGNPNAVDPHLRPETADEATFSLEHSFRPEFAVTLQGTWRRTRNILEDRLLVRDEAGAVHTATFDDWERAGSLTGFLPNGTPYDVPYYDLRAGLTPTGGHLLVNGDRTQDALGLSLGWQKRLTHNWMSSGHIAWRDWTWHLGPAFRRFDDPTNTLGNGDDDGSQVTPAASGETFPHDPARFLGGRWSLVANGFVSLPHDFEAALTVNGTQGAPLAWYRQISRPRAGLADVQLTGRADSFRTADLATFDARLGKDFSRGDFGVLVSLEAFNLLDKRATVARDLDLGVSRGGQADELVAPRTFELDVRFRWR